MGGGCKPKILSAVIEGLESTSTINNQRNGPYLVPSQLRSGSLHDALNISGLFHFLLRHGLAHRRPGFATNERSGPSGANGVSLYAY